MIQSFYKTKVITTRGLIIKKKLILSNSRPRWVFLRNLRKGLSTFLHQAYLTLDTFLQQAYITLDMWLSFFIYFAEKRSILCWCNFILCVYLAWNFMLGRICKVTIREHMNKPNSQNRRNLNSINLQTKSTGSENSVSVGSWHVALRK